MRINVDLSRLWDKANVMGPAVDFDLDDFWQDLDIEFDNELSGSGIDISLDDLESEQGLLSYRGRQVVLFIPDHGYRLNNVINDPTLGNKFHIAECKKLEEMRAKNRFERYKVRNNSIGIFEIFGTDEKNKYKDGKVELNVCKLCLMMLNYQGSKNTSVSGRNKVVRNFELKAFFSTYSSVFKYLPKQSNVESGNGYVENWQEISTSLRKKANYKCASCEVALGQKVSLLHVHHKNGVKSDNSENNLVVLCVDCHKKEPYHNHMFVKHSDIQFINRSREEQGLLRVTSWDSVYRFADTAVHGILDLCQHKKYSMPVVGYKISDAQGKVIAELELAWPGLKVGVYLGNSIKVEGWHLLNHEQALNYF